MAAPFQLGVDYENEKEIIKDFLNKFRSTEKDLNTTFSNIHINDEQDGQDQEQLPLKYMDQLQQIANRDQQMLVVDLEDIHSYEQTVAELVDRIRQNTRRYVTLFSDVIDTLMPAPTKDITEQDEVIDVVLHQRRERNARVDGGQDDGFPEHLLRR
ncbi:DNA replication licensing factor MCM7 [Marasmius tenuissimus]|uniref:DNA replication licensing factor MCM7 n=1 Tax=Marasmius tenuissimus TaxID=585030 RepID=A0ABR3A1S6_9AGAR